MSENEQTHEPVVEVVDAPPAPQIEVASETPVNQVVPVAPDHATDQHEERFTERAQQLINQLIEDPTDLTVEESVRNLGREPQGIVTKNVKLLQTRVGDLLNQIEDEEGGIPGNLLQMRMKMDELNPGPRIAKVKNIKGARRAFLKLVGKLPGVGDVLKEMAHKFETVQEQIDAIIAGLEQASDQLLRDNVELNQLYKNVNSGQEQIALQRYAGEIISQHIDLALQEHGNDSVKRQKLEALQNLVLRRIQNLKVTEQANLQFFVGIDMTMSNNNSLRDSIFETITVSRNLLTVGLSIQAALFNQKRANEALAQTQGYMSDLLVQNAEMIHDQSISIEEMKQKPVLALDKIETAYNLYLDTMNKTEQIRRDGTQAARDGIQRLNNMNEVMEQKADVLHSTKDSNQQLNAGTSTE